MPVASDWKCIRMSREQICLNLNLKFVKSVANCRSPPRLLYRVREQPVESDVGDSRLNTSQISAPMFSPEVRERTSDKQALWRQLFLRRAFGVLPPPRTFSHACFLCIEEHFCLPLPSVVWLLVRQPRDRWDRRHRDAGQRHAPARLALAARGGALHGCPE